MNCPLDDWLLAECGAGAEISADLSTKLAAAQLRRLQKTLERARGSRFYRERLADVFGKGGMPDSAPSFTALLAALPFTTPADLRGYEDFLTLSLGEVERIVTLTTSGTTGTPKRIAFSARDLARTADFFGVGMGMLVHPGGTLAVLLPGAERPDGVADLLRQALERRGVTVQSPPPELVRCAEKQAENLARWLLHNRPQALVAAPGQLAKLLPLFPETPPGLMGILASAEPLPASVRDSLHRDWHVTVLDHYGLTESCFGCAVECPAHDGYHLRHLDMLVEIVDPAGTAPMSPGEAGEIVLTTFLDAMPLIRYRTGDVASLVTHPCACGSPLPRLGPVLGRIRHTADGHVEIVQPKKGGATLSI